MILDRSGGDSRLFCWWFWVVVVCFGRWFNVVLVLVLSSSRYVGLRFWVVVGVVLGLF